MGDTWEDDRADEDLLLMLAAYCLEPAADCCPSSLMHVCSRHSQPALQPHHQASSTSTQLCLSPAISNLQRRHASISNCSGSTGKGRGVEEEASSLVSSITRRKRRRERLALQARSCHIKRQLTGERSNEACTNGQSELAIWSQSSW